MPACLMCSCACVRATLSGLKLAQVLASGVWCLALMDKGYGWDCRVGPVRYQRMRGGDGQLTESVDDDVRLACIW